MNELTLVKEDNLVGQLESFGIATNLPQRLVIQLHKKKDSDITALKNKSKNESEYDFLYTRYLIPAIIGALGGLISGIFNVIMVIAVVIMFLLGRLDAEFAGYLILNSLLTGSMFGMFYLAYYLEERKFFKSLIPAEVQIRQACEINISRLSSDPLFLLEQAQLFCEEQKKLIDEDLQKIDVEFKEKISDPLEKDKLNLTKWQGSVIKLRSYTEQQLPDQEAMVQQALANVSKYEQLIAQTSSDKKTIEAKKKFVEEQLADMDKGINFIVALQTEYRDIDSIIADLKAESGQDDFSEQATQMRLRAIQKINNSLDDLIASIQAIQIGIVNMAQALPEPEKFGVNARLQLAA